jgi:hypothetical protein
MPDPEPHLQHQSQVITTQKPSCGLSTTPRYALYAVQTGCVTLWLSRKGCDAVRWCPAGASTWHHLESPQLATGVCDTCVAACNSTSSTAWSTDRHAHGPCTGVQNHVSAPTWPHIFQLKQLAKLWNCSFQIGTLSGQATTAARPHVVIGGQPHGINALLRAAHTHTHAPTQPDHVCA